MDKPSHFLFADSFEELSKFVRLQQFESAEDFVDALWDGSVNPLLGIEPGMSDSEALKKRSEFFDQYQRTEELVENGQIEKITLVQPNRLHLWAKGEGYKPSEVPLKGAIIALRKELKLKSSSRGGELEVLPIAECTNVPISFFSDGARAQQHRLPGVHGGSNFLRRAEALQAMGSLSSPDRSNRVHVFVIDQGMDPDYVETLAGTGSYGGVIWDSVKIKWPTSPEFELFPLPPAGSLPMEQRDRHQSRPQWHAHMILRNILSVSGTNKNLRRAEKPIIFYDVPVVPNRVGDVGWTSVALYFQMRAVLDQIIKILTQNFGDRVVVVNAWGIKNRLRENSEQPVSRQPDNWLNVLVRFMASSDHIATVFAAGNSGLFHFDPEAGPYDRGPSKSIWFPNALPGVVTVGAADATGQWIGSSSQGPSDAPGTNPVPDFTAPSYFREDQDAHVVNTGSSASCGLLAGLIAAHWRASQQPLDIAKAKASARKSGHLSHSGRLGHGLVQAGTF